CGLGLGVLACQAGTPGRDDSQLAARCAPAPEEPTPAAQALAVLKDARKAADAIEDRRGEAERVRAVGEGQAKGGDRTTAAQTFQDAIKVASDLVEPFKRQTLANIAISQAESGDLKRARQTLESVEDEGTHKGALVRIAGAQARAGDAKGALLI